MKIFTLVAVLCSTLLMTFQVMGQENWPKSATTSEGTVLKLYQWQPESFADNTLKAHAAISILEKGKTDPVFGVAWIKATTATNGQQVQVQSIYITDIKLPGETDHNKLESLANSMEDNVSSWNISFPMSDLQTSLDLNKQQSNLSSQINNTPPKVIYSNVPSIMVLIDGAPKLQHNNDWGVDAVVNTPFVLVKNNNDRYYLYGGKHWYSATAATGPYNMVTNVPSNLEKIEGAVRDANKNNSNEGKETDANTIYNIIVSTEPAELIQSRGEANFSSIQGTGLLYVANSENDIFMDINSQQYYVLLSGRWYHSKTLSGQWQYVPSDQLPEDFAKIPKGSPKDNVLASVAGTEQANDAVANAQVPQTAKVERSKVHADVNYDGDPEFEAIDGTDMYYAVNTPVSVIRWRGRYYCVDDGIWFESYSAIGPWSVCIARPYAVALIPPRYPVYYMKYVDIYDVTPDYVYMGYTPGYLNAYVYGPTVVYGTGYYYHPWYRRYYYPRPCTWGFGVRYNPWFGWGFGVGFDYGWLHVGIGFGDYWGGYWGCGGWWGPRVYRPCYYGSPYYYRGGYYGHNSYNVYRSSTVNVVNNYYINNNIYRGRQGVVTRDYPRYGGPDRGGRFGRQEFAGNGPRFEGNRGGRFDNNRNFPTPDRGGRQATINPGGNGRGWNAPGSNNPGGRVVIQPQNNERGYNRNTFNNQRNSNPVRDNFNRGSQQPGSGFRSVPEQPRRFESPSGNNGFSGGRPQPTGGYSPAPRTPERRENNGGGFSRPSGGFPGSSGGGGFSRPTPSPSSGGGGGGGFSRPSFGGGSNSGGGGGRPSGGGGGGSFGRGGRRP